MALLFYLNHVNAFVHHFKKHKSQKSSLHRVKYQNILRVELLEDRYTPADLTLSTGEVRSLAAAATQQWIEAGISPSQFQALEKLNYQVADLGGNNLGQLRGSTITIDDNAAGNLWFVDDTPNLNEEFTGSGQTFVAHSGSLADGKMDLLTVLMHEQGHALGLAGLVGPSDDVMNEALEIGERRLPASGQAENAKPGSLTTTEYLTSAAAGGNQPFDNRQPFAVTNYLISLEGIYPTQNDNANSPPTTPFTTAGGQPYIGEISLFAGNFAPRGFAFANGQIFSIAQNTALFSLLGTTFGGNGTSNFALPDLRGRTPIGAGQGPGLTNVDLGEVSGAESTTLTVAQIPPHQHSISGRLTDSTGGGQPHSNMMPTLGLNPIIDTNGEVRWVPYYFAPRGSAFANGQILPITGNNTLYSNIGTTYGGNGVTTFALPDLRGRVVMDDGNGNGLTSWVTGALTGQETETLTVNQLPSHSHGIPGSGTSTGITGGGQPFDKMQPSLALNFQISLVGIYPSRNLSLEDSDLPAIDSQGKILSEAEAETDLNSLVQEATDRWAAAGIGADGIAKLRAATYQFGSLDAGVLGSVDGPDHVTLDRDAAGLAWFVDTTPADDVEFGGFDPSRGLLATTLEAQSGVDLLTVLMHEQGHLLGFEHDPTPGHLMSASLVVGARRLPTGNEVVGQPGAEGLEQDLQIIYQPFIAEIHLFAAPQQSIDDFLPTSGQLLPIQQNAALFSLLGTYYGGNGTSNFALPDFQGRVVVGAGQAPGGSNYDLGELAGHESVTLTVAQMPTHSHNIVNSVPVAQDSSVTTNEDMAKTFAASDFQFTDADSDSLVSITVGSLTLASRDTLMVDQGFGPVTVTNGMTITAAQIPNLTYTPAADANGLARSTFSFTVNDFENGTVAATMTINVTPINDAPKFTSGTSLDVPENTTSVTTVTATDADNDPLSFGIAGGADSGKFTITSGGTLSFVTAPDFENPTDANSDGVYEVTVSVSDGIAPAVTQSVSVTVTDTLSAYLSGNVLLLDGTTVANDITLRLLSGDPTQTEVVSGVNTVLGTFANASFTSVNATLYGGDDTLSIRNGNGNPVPSGGIQYDGGTGTNTLVGPKSANTWNLSGLNAGDINSTITFSNVQNLTGGAGDDIFTFGASGSVAGAIDGSGGTDTLDYSLSSTAVTVNLSTTNATNTGSVSNIENIIGSNFDDSLTGDGGRNALTGGGGNDALAGNGNDDRYFFNTDSDQGDDTISESGGNDTLDFSATTTQTVTVDLGIATAQMVNSNLILTLGSASTVENVVGGALNDSLTGNSLGNVLIGLAGDDILSGQDGSDVYGFDTDTQLGSDTISETTGNDTLTFAATTTQNVAVNLGIATAQVVNSNLTLTLGSDSTIENVVGGTLNDILTGNSRNNKLNGQRGDDRYVFDTDTQLGRDAISEFNGTDTLTFAGTSTKNVTVNLGLGTAQVINSNLILSLGSASAIEYVVGGSLDDSLTGNSLNNILNGQAGDDRYIFNTDSVQGDDTISESGGNDTLDFSATTTQTVTVDLGMATAQMVNSNLTLTLGSASTVENVVGGALNDSLTGNSLDNILIGLAGDDILSGQAGSDVYDFDTDTQLGSDTISETTGIDTLTFAATTMQNVAINLGVATAQVVNSNLTLTLGSASTLEYVVGGTLDDTLTGNSRNNILNGQTGNDTYVFNADSFLGNDAISESGVGTDTVDFSGTTTQAVAVNLGIATGQVVSSNLTLTLGSASTVENVVGGSLDDTLTGNSLNNVLSGGAGNDSISGGAGRDILIGGAGADTLGGGNDEDVLLGARFSQETNITALLALIAEWTRTDLAYQNRIDHLSGANLVGANNDPFYLTTTGSTTVTSDGAIDVETGNADFDWFFSHSGDVTDASGETVTPIP